MLHLVHEDLDVGILLRPQQNLDGGVGIGHGGGFRGYDENYIVGSFEEGHHLRIDTGTCIEDEIVRGFIQLSEFEEEILKAFSADVDQFGEPRAPAKETRACRPAAITSARLRFPSMA